MGIRISGSRLSLLFKCAYPFRPEVDVPEQDSVGRPAHTGVGFASLREHDLEPGRRTEAPELPAQARLDVHYVGGKTRAERLIARWRLWWEGYRDADSTMRWESEIPFAFDPVAGTARRLPISEHRAYEGALPHELVGTADMVGTSATSIIVLDDKTGQREYVGPAKDNRQLGFLSLCHSLVTGIRRGKVGLVFPHLDEPLDEVPFGPEDVERSLLDFRALPDRIAASKPEIGDHCRICPLRQVCPAWKPPGLASTDDFFAARPRPGAVSSGSMARVRIFPPNDGSAAAISSSPAVSAPRPQTAEDNDFAPKRGEVPRNVPVIREDLARIVDRICAVPSSEYDRLEAELRVGDRRSSVADLTTALDGAEANALVAQALYVAACIERSKWEVAAEIRFAPSRNGASQALEQEKKDKLRTKPITDSDVDSKMATMYPDEYRWREEQEGKFKALERQLARLADLWQSRCETLRVMLEKMR